MLSSDRKSKTLIGVQPMRLDVSGDIQLLES